jgi:hypothetical protein
MDNSHQASIETPDKDGKMKVVDAGVTDKPLLV